MNGSRHELAARLRRLLQLQGPRREGVTTPPSSSPETTAGVPTPQQLSDERKGADPVWDC